jgi:hypothetical protein
MNFIGLVGAHRCALIRSQIVRELRTRHSLENFHLLDAASEWCIRPVLVAGQSVHLRNNHRRSAPEMNSVPELANFLGFGVPQLRGLADCRSFEATTEVEKALSNFDSKYA